MILRVLGIGEGDEVITTAYTYTATASVIAHVGAKIVMVDVDKDSYQMNMDQVEAAVTEKTKAIIMVDLGGRICDYTKAFEIAEEKKYLFQPKLTFRRRWDVLQFFQMLHMQWVQSRMARCAEVLLTSQAFLSMQ